MKEKSDITETVNKNPDYNKNSIIVYDWDKNGIADSFQLDIYNENILSNINGIKSTIQSSGTQFGKLKEKGFQTHNKIKDSIFCFINSPTNKEVLVLKDLGDFSGSILYIYELIENKPNKLWEGYGEVISFEDLNSDKHYEIVLKDIVQDPGSISGYDYIEYPLFRVYNFRNNKILFDSTLSSNYNLINNPQFKEAIGMKKPIRTRKWGSNSNTFDLIMDEEDLKNNHSSAEIYEKME